MPTCYLGRQNAVAWHISFVGLRYGIMDMGCLGGWLARYYYVLDLCLSPLGGRECFPALLARLATTGLEMVFTEEGEVGVGGVVTIAGSLPVN